MSTAASNDDGEHCTQKFNATRCLRYFHNILSISIWYRKRYECECECIYIYILWCHVMCLCVIQAKIMCHTIMRHWLVFGILALWPLCLCYILHRALPFFWLYGIWCLSLMLETYVLVKLFAEMQYTLKVKVCFGSGIYGFLKKILCIIKRFQTFIKLSGTARNEQYDVVKNKIAPFVQFFSLTLFIYKNTQTYTQTLHSLCRWRSVSECIVSGRWQ